jgi:hypothetical protein
MVTSRSSRRKARSKRALAQVVSVQVWGTWGPRFESGMPERRVKRSPQGGLFPFISIPDSNRVAQALPPGCRRAAIWRRLQPIPIGKRRVATHARQKDQKVAARRPFSVYKHPGLEPGRSGLASGIPPRRLLAAPSTHSYRQAARSDACPKEELKGRRKAAFFRFRASRTRTGSLRPCVRAAAAPPFGGAFNPFLAVNRAQRGMPDRKIKRSP